MDGSPAYGWEDDLERWLEPFLERLKREAQRPWAPVYLKGLILPGERNARRAQEHRADGRADSAG
jgi:hypothetical protein